jgi:uncharacterized protein (DUF362 family)
MHVRAAWKRLRWKNVSVIFALAVLPALMFSNLLATLAAGSEQERGMDGGFYWGSEFDAASAVSVAYNASVTAYPSGTESPYGPDVNPTYHLVEEALIRLNPADPNNPLSNIIQDGDTVVLKPNLVGKSGFAREGCTRTAVLRPLVDLAVRAGASKVIIAEGSAFPYPDSAVFGPDYSNITGLVQALQSMNPSVNITFKDLNLDDFTWVNLAENSSFHEAYTPQQLYSKSDIRMDENSYYHAADHNGYNPNGYTPGLYAIANTVFQADVFINVPKLKVHMITGVTMSLKNLIGITVASTGNTTREETIKDVPHWNHSAPEHASGEVLTAQDSFENDVVWRVMADLNRIVLYADDGGTLQPVKQRGYLSVVDAVIGMEGPTAYNPPGTPRPTGVIIAGQDPVAVDAVGSRVMGFNHTLLNSIHHIDAVLDHPIGSADPAYTCVLGASLDADLFGDPYVPHRNYEDLQMSPERIRLQSFAPPEAARISSSPSTLREDMETQVIVGATEPHRVAAGWLRYSIDDSQPAFLKLTSNGQFTANLGLLQGGSQVQFSVCLQDPYFNMAWSTPVSMFVGFLETFVASWEESTFQVETISNSTVTAFSFNQTAKQVSFTVTGLHGTTGFCNITIPSSLLGGPYTVEVGGETVLEDYNPPTNGTHAFVYFTYSHSTQTVEIRGVTAIPEFPSFAILLLLVTTALLTVYAWRKHSKAPSKSGRAPHPWG